MSHTVRTHFSLVKLGWLELGSSLMLGTSLTTPLFNHGGSLQGGRSHAKNMQHCGTEHRSFDHERRNATIQSSTTAMENGPVMIVDEPVENDDFSVAMLNYQRVMPNDLPLHWSQFREGPESQRVNVDG